MEFKLLKNKFSKDDARRMNPLVLAFIGDAVYETFIRTYLAYENREMSVHKLHVEAVKYVKAHAQCEFLKVLEKELTEEEIYIYKRGRNAKSGTVPKNADVVDYRCATGFETLIGFLYVTEQVERLNYILNSIVSVKENGGK